MARDGPDARPTKRALPAGRGMVAMEIPVKVDIPWGSLFKHTRVLNIIRGFQFNIIQLVLNSIRGFQFNIIQLVLNSIQRRRWRPHLPLRIIVTVFTIFHLIPLALALVIHGTEYAFDLSSKLTLGRGIVFVIKALSQGWAWRARAWRAIIDPVVFRAIDVVAVPRLGSIVKILILSLAEIGLIHF